MEFLELPPEMAHLVAPDAPRRVEAVRFELHLAGETREFLAGLWPHSFDETSRSYGLKMLVKGGWHPDLPLLKFMLFLRATRLGEMDSATRGKIAREARSQMLQGASARSFRVDGEVEWRVFPLRTEFRSASHVTECDPDSALYANGYFDLSDADYERLLQTALADFEHPLSQALRWHRSSEDERLEWFGRTEKGNLSQILGVMRSLGVVVFHIHREKISESYEWDWVSLPNLWQWGDLFDEEYEDEFRAVQKRWEAFFERWLQAIKSALKPHFLWKKDVPVFLRDFWHESDPSIFIFDGAPTSHEFLEAQLFLCDWARENAPELAEKLLDFPA